MEGTMWPTIDNSTQLIENAEANVSINATMGLPTTLRNPRQQSILLVVRFIIGLGVGIVGSLANTVVLTVLTLARREYGSNVNTLIINQCVMDLLTCVSVVIAFVIMLTHDFVYRGNQIIDNMICIFLQSGLIPDIGLTAGKFGLVVITLERYFKIVHAVAHRKHYHDWMTKVGVALPWIGSVCLVLFPSIGTTRFVNGRCLKWSVWPNKGMAQVSKL